MIQKAAQINLQNISEYVSVLEIDNGVNNTLNIEGLDDLYSILSTLADDDPKVILITGKGERSFCMGYSSNCSDEANNSAVREARDLALSAVRMIRASRHYFLAGINGYALDLGIELALASDLSIASSRAKLGMPGLKYGMPPFTGVLTDTTLNMTGEAYSHLKSGNLIDANQASNLGLVDNVVDYTNFRREILNYCRSLNPEYLSNYKVVKRPEVPRVDSDRLFFQVYRVSCKSIMDLERFRNSL